jgi:hypothetical protein
MRETELPSGVVWFSEFFGIDLPQYELPFVDFNLNSDVPLYIDPYAITKDPTDLAARAHNSIISYFQELLDAIRRDDKVTVRRLVRGHLSEPGEIHLGVGKTARRGRGFGIVQENQIVQALTASRAVQAGVIQAIQELELHIEGVGPDKISDLVSNVVLRYLAEFTQTMCEEYGISTQPCALSGFWNQERKEWDGDYFNLPAYEERAYVLVPKRWVRRQKDLMNHEEFYNKYILNVLERELISADDSLVYALKSGERRVTKKSMKEDPRFRPSKRFISQFIIENPHVIEDYRQSLRAAFNPTDPAFWSGKSAEDDPKITDALARLDTLKPGRRDANTYHDTVLSLIEFVFDWALENFKKERKMDGERSRIDIVADNNATGGLLLLWRVNFNARTIPMECKNYSADLGNEEFNQMVDRLGKKTSRIGIVFCRTISDTAYMLQHRTNRWLRQDVLILLIDDVTLKHLVALRLDRNVHEIERVLSDMVSDVQYGAGGPN